MQNVSTPRIYVDWGSWLKAIGKFELAEHSDDLMLNVTDSQTIYNLIGLNVSVKTLPTTGVNNWHSINMTSGAFGNLSDFPNYCAVLGHNFATVGNRFSIETYDGTDKYGMDELEIINYGGAGQNIGYNGFTITEFNTPSSPGTMYDEYLRPIFPGWDGSSMVPHTQDLKIGAICYGKYYDFPHSPDVNLTMTIENDGVTTQQTTGGATHSILRHKGVPNWGSLGAWELGDGSDASTLGARTGRRNWDLKFSFLSDKQTLPINALGNTVFDIDNASSYDSTDYDAGMDIFESNILNGEDFFSAVWSKTMGGHLPFIFQPDKNNNNPDQFAICRFDMDSLKIRQTAPELYSISLKIRESW
tara:strand:+ start:1023 stop:2099 length:1077 start_codon:yes stop_codon:yes gene_type:complete